MAGKVARLARYCVVESPPLKLNGSAAGNMEQSAVLDQLNDRSLEKRIETLDRLQFVAQRNGGLLPFEDPQCVFRGLGVVLADPDPDVRMKCMQLVYQLIPKLGRHLDACMFTVLDNLVPALGDDKTTIRRTALQTVHQYMKFTDRFEELARAISRLALEHGNERIRIQSILSLPILLTQNFSRENFFPIVQSLAKNLARGSDGGLEKCCLSTLRKVQDLVGPSEFRSYFCRLPGAATGFFYEQLAENGPHARLGPAADREFGIIPGKIIAQIRGEDDFRARIQAVDELKKALQDSPNNEINRRMTPHMLPFINFVSGLLDDPNFKIITVSLDIVSILVEKLDENVQHFLTPLLTALMKKMGNNTNVVRQQGVMKVVKKVMHSHSPREVLRIMMDNLKHKNSRVRQEMVNIVIAALLMFPSYEFDLTCLCKNVVPLLIDPKRSVRQAALECIAVLAQAMGQGRYQPLVEAVNNAEVQGDAEGLLLAVQDRLARRQLPRLDNEGLVEYAMPSSASQRSLSGTKRNADIDWILAGGSGGSSSARSSRGSSDVGDLDSSQYMLSSSASFPEASSPSVNSRRFLSAGKGRNKLPWDSRDKVATYDDLPGSAPAQSARQIAQDGPPLKPRSTWSSLENEGEKYLSGRQPILASPKDESPETGSYTQIYLKNRSKKQEFSSSRSGTLHTENVNAKDSKPDNNVFWLSSKKSEDCPKPPRTKLNPISGKDVEESSIPRKPTIVRGSTTNCSNRSKVPPIVSSTEKISISWDDIKDNSCSLHSENTFDESPEMMFSLKNIRDSASKRRAEKLEKRNNQHNFDSRSPSPPTPDFFDSDIHSLSFHEDSDDDLEVKRKTSPQKTIMPDSFKSKFARSSSLRMKRNRDLNEDSKKPGPWSDSSSECLKSNTSSNQNRATDVQIVGKGYGDDSSETKPALLNYSNNKPGERRRLPKGMFNPPFSLLHTHGMADRLDDRPLNQDTIGVVGKSLNPSESIVSCISSVMELNEKRPIRQNTKTVPEGIVGIGVRSEKQSQGESTAKAEELAEKLSTLSTSNNMGDHLFVRQLNKQAVLDRKRAEKEQKNEEKLRRERERQQEKLKQISTSDFEVFQGTGNLFKAIPVKLPATSRINRKQISEVEQGVFNSSKTPSQDINDQPENWKPVKEPMAMLHEAQNKLSQTDWELKRDGLVMIRHLCLFHPEIVCANLHSVILAVLKEAKNLRSQVARMAIVCLNDMFTYLKRNMDLNLDQTVQTLLDKNSANKDFILDTVEKALTSMVSGVTPQRALAALISGGTSHRNAAVRKTASKYIGMVVEKMGAARVLGSMKDVTDKLLPTAAQLVSDSSLETRYHWKKIINLLMSHPDFDKMAAKHLSTENLKTLKDVAEILKAKGLQEMPSEISSAHSRRSFSSARGSSAGSMTENVRTPVSAKQSMSFRNNEVIQEEIKQLYSLLLSDDWRNRRKGLADFLELCKTNTPLVSANILQMFDKFLPRLQDPNSKVNLYALQVMLQVIPILHSSLASVINMTVQHIAPNLSCKNKEIHDITMKVLDSLIEHLDSSILLQPFASQASSSSRNKAEMVYKVADLVDNVCVKKQKQVILHVLPLLNQLLKSMPSSNNITSAMVYLIQILYSHMDAGLVEEFNRLSSTTPKLKEQLEEIICHL